MDELSISHLSCNPQPSILRPGERYCASLSAVDLAGSVSAPVDELCAQARACRPASATDESGPSPECLELDEGESGGPEEQGGCSLGHSASSSAGLFLLAFLALARLGRRPTSA